MSGANICSDLLIGGKWGCNAALMEEVKYNLVGPSIAEWRWFGNQTPKCRRLLVRLAATRGCGGIFRHDFRLFVMSLLHLREQDSSQDRIWETGSEASNHSPSEVMMSSLLHQMMSWFNMKCWYKFYQDAWVSNKKSRTQYRFDYFSGAVFKSKRIE